MTDRGQVWGASQISQVIGALASDGSGRVVSSLVPSSTQNARGPGEIWLRSASPAANSERGARQLISNPEYDLYQPHFSPNGVGRGFESPMAGIGTTSLAGLRMGKRFISFPAVAVSLMFSEYASIHPRERQLGTPFGSRLLRAPP